MAPSQTELPIPKTAEPNNPHDPSSILPSTIDILPSLNQSNLQTHDLPLTLTPEPTSPISGIGCALSVEAHSTTPQATAIPGPARRFYDIPHLWLSVLSLVNRRTVARCLRLEKAAAADTRAIGLLYRSIHESVANSLDANSPRGQIIRDAVRVIDLSPLPSLAYELARAAGGSVWDSLPPPIKFNSTTLRRQVEAYRKLFHHLHTILYQYPAHTRDDAYVVHIDGERISVDLECHVEVRPYSRDEDIPINPASIKLPYHDSLLGNLTVRRTIVLHLNENDDLEERYYMSQRHFDHVSEWREWLWCDAELDGRVTRIDWGGNSEICSDRIGAELEQLLGGDDRVPNIDTSLPITFIIPLHLYIQFTIHQLLALTPLALSRAPQLRDLVIYFTTFSSYDELHEALLWVDNTFPSLQQLDIRFEPSWGPSQFKAGYTPLSGFQNLRSFTFRSHREMYSLGGSNWAVARLMAQAICRLGSDECFYHNRDEEGKEDKERFNTLVKTYRREANW